MSVTVTNLDGSQITYGYSPEHWGGTLSSSTLMQYRMEKSSLTLLRCKTVSPKISPEKSGDIFLVRR
jgi:hypothetical protein